MNRQQRRLAERVGIPVYRALKVCQRCGAPICPVCGDETLECECCGEFNCESCRAYVLAPTVSLS